MARKKIHTAESLHALVVREALGMPIEEQKRFVDLMLSQPGIEHDVGWREMDLAFRAFAFQGELKEQKKRAIRRKPDDAERDLCIYRDSHKGGGNLSYTQLEIKYNLSRTSIQNAIKRVHNNAIIV